MIEFDWESLFLFGKFILALLSLVIVLCIIPTILGFLYYGLFALSPFILVAGVANFITPGQQAFGLAMIALSICIVFIFIIIEDIVGDGILFAIRTQFWILFTISLVIAISFAMIDIGISSLYLVALGVLLFGAISMDGSRHTSVY
jgi:hypothetical protein